MQGNEMGETPGFDQKELRKESGEVPKRRFDFRKMLSLGGAADCQMITMESGKEAEKSESKVRLKIEVPRMSGELVSHILAAPFRGRNSKALM